jgi:hypothetical protein
MKNKFLITVLVGMIGLVFDLGNSFATIANNTVSNRATPSVPAEFDVTHIVNDFVYLMAKSYMTVNMATNAASYTYMNCIFGSPKYVLIGNSMLIGRSVTRERINNRYAGNYCALLGSSKCRYCFNSGRS